MAYRSTSSTTNATSSPLTTHEFEGVQLSVPGNSHHMLTTQYGDYMQLPDLDNIQGHISKLEIYD